MSQAPKASVILPVYNAGHYLAYAIESVLQQTFTEFELLLLNDGSTDGSLEVMQRYAAQDERCHVITRENKGLVYTLNEGVELARTEVLFRMDADDLCLPTRFAKQMAYLDAHPECVAVGSRVMLIDPDGDPLCPFVDTFDHAAIDVAHMQGLGGAIAHPAVAMRRPAVMAVGGYRSAFKHAEDLDLFLRMAEYGQLANLPEVLFMYRQHPNSIGYKYRKEQAQSANLAIKQSYKRRGIQFQNIDVSAADNSDNEVSDVYKRWAWWAIGNKNRRVALKYAFKYFFNFGMSIDFLKIIFCITRGR